MNLVFLTSPSPKAKRNHPPLTYAVIITPTPSREFYHHICKAEIESVREREREMCKPLTGTFIRTVYN